MDDVQTNIRPALCLAVSPQSGLAALGPLYIRMHVFRRRADQCIHCQRARACRNLARPREHSGKASGQTQVYVCANTRGWGGGGGPGLRTHKLGHLGPDTCAMASR